MCVIEFVSNHYSTLPGTVGLFVLALDQRSVRDLVVNVRRASLGAEQFLVAHLAVHVAVRPIVVG